jgi:hypothetical protein
MGDNDADKHDQPRPKPEPRPVDPNIFGGTEKKDGKPKGETRPASSSASETWPGHPGQGAARRPNLTPRLIGVVSVGLFAAAKITGRMPLFAPLARADTGCDR